ncbi:MAG: hypothetical protein FJY75_11550, partial [Candidatus Eisenbacteria bacterium]|nr:hypothetical protein [Candidatus Eisenbacteria bacterium]
RIFYERHGRTEQYRAWAARIKEERRVFLLKMGVEEEILDQVHYRLAL